MSDQSCGAHACRDGVAIVYVQERKDSTIYVTLTQTQLVPRRKAYHDSGQSNHAEDDPQEGRPDVPS